MVYLALLLIWIFIHAAVCVVIMGHQVKQREAKQSMMGRQLYFSMCPQHWRHYISTITCQLKLSIYISSNPNDHIWQLTCVKLNQMHDFCRQFKPQHFSHLSLLKWPAVIVLTLWPSLLCPMWQHSFSCVFWGGEKKTPPEYFANSSGPPSGYFIKPCTIHHFLLFSMVMTLNVECGCEVIMLLLEGWQKTLGSLLRLNRLPWKCFNIVANQIFPRAIINPLNPTSQRGQTICHHQFPICSLLPVFPYWYVNISDLLLLGFHWKTFVFEMIWATYRHLWFHRRE